MTRGCDDRERVKLWMLCVNGKVDESGQIRLLTFGKNSLCERNLGFENLTILYRKGFDLSITRPDSIVSYRVLGFWIF